MDQSTSKQAGIKEIAQALGISIGTVDRALHNRGGVNSKTQEKVLKMAERLNYKPNLAARSLKLNRRLRIAVHLPTEIAFFFDLLRDGIRTAAAAMPGIQLDLDFRAYPRMGEEDLVSLERDLEAGYDGILMTPGNPSSLESLIARFTAAGTAVICVASDAPRSSRLTSVCVDAAVSGGIAAELLGKAIRTDGYVASITGDLTTYDHAEKLRGFAGTLATIAPHLTHLPAVETHERPESAYKATVDLLKRKQKPLGIYVSTANSSMVLKAVEERGLLGTIEIVTTDLFPELAALLESGKILATLYQRPFAQGKIAFESMTRYLLQSSQPEPSTRLAPHIVLRSNLALFPSKLERNSDFERYLSTAAEAHA